MNAFYALGIMFVLQLLIYFLFLKRYILSWGATNEETTRAFPGDYIAPVVNATRAINLNVPITKAWKQIIQLGADRGGFYSYTFLEKWMGYIFDPDKPEADDMPVGRVVPTSIDESKSFIKYNFPVLQSEENKYYVLGGWGTFWLDKLDEGNTRLIVRTNSPQKSNPVKWFKETKGEAEHYIMERRMLEGLKAAAEGKEIDNACDFNWFLFLVLSAIGITALPFVGGNMLAYGLTVGLGTMWLFNLLYIRPKGPYVLGLVVSTIASLFVV